MVKQLSDKPNNDANTMELAMRPGGVGSVPEIETGIERPRRIGLIIAFLVFGVFGIWATFAPIEGAALAPGVIKVESYNKVVQHLEGGIVKAINVKNGDRVNAGDVLLVLDQTQSLSRLEILRGQQLTQTAIEARLLAERDGHDTVSYPTLVRGAGDQGETEMQAQNHIFRTRKAGHEGSIAVLQQRIGQLESRLDGLRAMRESKQMLAGSFWEELQDYSSLLEEGFTEKQRLRQLERNHAQSSAEAAELTATIASNEIQIGETRLEIIQERNRFQNEVANQLAEVQSQIKDVRERITALQDVVNRTDIRAPIAGLVNNLNIHTEGAVISGSNPIMEIVPESDDLVIQASVSPADIERVAEGQDANVRLSTLASGSIPTLHGTVLSVSADALTRDNDNATYYQAIVKLTPASREQLQGIQLVPGMPAEVMINTGSRTFLQYVMRPISNAVAQGLRED